MTSSLSSVTYSFQASNTQYIPQSVPPSEQVAVVTGANKGLGFGIVKGLCEQFDGYIYLTARDKQKGKEAVQVLKDMKVCKNPDKLRFYELNIVNEDHVDNFYMDLRDTHGGIDILINNAGIAYKRNSEVPFAEQAEKTIRTNYLGLVQVCVFLFPLLRPHGRVVNLSSSSGHLSQISKFSLKKRLMDENLTEKQLTDIMFEFMDITKESRNKHIEVGWPNSAYAVSKIGVNILTRIYQNKFDIETGNRDLVINSVHPGYFASNMSSYMGNTNIFEAAEAPIYLATLPPNIVSPRGEFVWSDCTIMDLDSATTPTRPDDIVEHDIITHIREYAEIYKTTSMYPQFKFETHIEDAVHRENIVHRENVTHKQHAEQKEHEGQKQHEEHNVTVDTNEQDYEEYEVYKNGIIKYSNPTNISCESSIIEVHN